MSSSNLSMPCLPVVTPQISKAINGNGENGEIKKLLILKETKKEEGEWYEVIQSDGNQSEDSRVVVALYRSKKEAHEYLEIKTKLMRKRSSNEVMKYEVRKRLE